MGELQLWPMANQRPDFEGNPTETILRATWRHMVEEGKEKWVFYDGSVQTEDEWLAYIRDPSVGPVFVIDADEKEIRAVVWINQYRDQIAQGHFCILGKWDPRIGKLIHAYWQKLGLILVYGIVPEVNERALAAMAEIGWQTAGQIPKTCNLFYEARRVAGVLIYFDLEEV